MPIRKLHKPCKRCGKMFLPTRGARNSTSICKECYKPKGRGFAGKGRSAK